MSRQKNLKRNLLICLLAGSAVMYTLPLHAATSVVANNALPQNGIFAGGDAAGSIKQNGNLELNVNQNFQNAVIKWESFDVGGSATVNFTAADAYKNNFNTLNYVNSGASASQIYGTINAQGGNIYIVNPAGVQIGNSAQINVGSLYVSNKNMDETLKSFGTDYAGYQNINISNLMGSNLNTTTNAALMSLGNINATNVTFEGDGRIVIDSERITNDANNATFRVNTNDAGNVLIGYDAYVETDKDKDGFVDGYKGQDKTFSNNVYVNGKLDNTVKGYMWVEDVEQLQAINTNLGGNYALRNSIDATSTDNGGEGFKPIGLDEIGKLKDNGFTGKFDGIDYNIFGLTINNNYTNVGLFGGTNGATINNVTLVGGSIIGGAHVGAVVGSALNGTVITNVVNSASVSGSDNTAGDNIGGVVGVAYNSTITNAVNTGAIDGKNNNVGGLVGLLENGSTLDGNSYNLGDVSGKGHNVGGLVGSASNSTIGNPSIVNGKPVENIETVYNRMDVTGAYNVGGIVGNMTKSTVQNAENSGTVLASGSVTDKYNYHTDIAGVNNLPDGSSLHNGIVSIDVNVANVGGIAGTSSGNSIITDVLNTGDISSGKGNGKENINNQEYNYEYYTAGNVGGIVGSAADTNITNATNRENEIRGAHNVGGVVGYFSGNGTIDKGINDGGDIMATGAHNGKGFVMESVRQSGDEDFIIGNIGGIVGYMEGNDVKVTGSANRGTVHTENIEDADNVLTISKAANVGGIVGKIDANTNENGLLTDFRNGNYENASVSNSYNTGNVTGYTGVGGVIGMMYNGSVAGSYNQGAINTTRQVYRGGGGYIDPLNMGGIVGDTTEQTSASAVIYDVYNEGQIGDKNFEFYARHVGGIVGRLSGTVEKAYNTGDIYNNDTAVGGIVGWWYNGNIKNVFNTGNITVRSATELQVGGIAGAAEKVDKTLENAYNLGTIRGYKEGVDASNNPQNGTDKDIYVGGIIGRARGRNALIIKNVYTMGNLYAGVGTYNDATGTYSYKHTQKNGLGAIYGGNEAPTLQGANYIVRDIDYKDYFKDLSGQSGVNDIIYSNRYKKDAYDFVNVGTTGDIFSDQKEESGAVSGAVKGATDDNWRIYEGSTTPILNAFLPNTEKYFDNKNLSDEGITSIQYGTAYDPLLTIINAKRDLSYDWNELGISGAASLAVYGGGLTLDNVDTSSGNGYYSGLLYTDKDLTLIATNKNNEPDETKVSGDIGLGSGAELYGSSVKIEADGTVTVYGSVTATGETEGSTGDINIKAGDVDVYGTLTTGKSVSIAGIEGSAQKVDTNFENVNNPNEAMIHISERFAHEINSVNGATSNITINAGTKLVVGDDGKPILDAEGNKQYVNIGDGNVNLYFGNKEQGLITTGGDLNVTGTGDVYVDSDLDIGDDLTLSGTGADSEVVLDITNIGQVQAKNGTVTDAVTGLHNFMHHFIDVNGDGANIYLNAEQSKDTKITVDMWNGNAFDLKKFDSENHDFKKELNSMNVTINDEILDGKEGNHVKDYTYIWVSDGEQLQGINATVNDGGLDFNYALKGDINASGVNNYEAIGTGSNTGFTGTFDGRGNRIIGLTVSGENAGIFSTIGTNGVVKDVNIYSGTFTGTTTAGAVAGKNKGRIEGIVTFGNTVTVTDEDGNAGGIVGINSSGEFKDNANDGELTGGIYDVESTGSVIAGSSSAVAGGLVGTNDGGLANSFSDSAVTVGTNVTGGTSAGLGGVVGVNTEKGNVQYVDSLGVTNGGATGSSNIGGIIGINNGNMYSGYNESIVSGSSNVGGIIGNNSSTVANVVNATSVTGNDKDTTDVSEYVGGLVGNNNGDVNNGRNNGTITGTKYVGGMVGNNAEGSTLTNLVNDSSAAISGVQYVGGIAGKNEGIITANSSNLINRGSITGNQYVGGVAGMNTGEIRNTVNSVVLNATGNDAKYFGGVAGYNDGTIGTVTNTSTIDVIAQDGTLVGGIIGYNAENGTLEGEIVNEGNISGESEVGGIIGENINQSILNNENKPRLTISNKGNVSATDGGAAGIFYDNKSVIDNVDLVNEGTVTGGAGANSITGGLFGVNSGNITNSTLTNNGEVTGGGAVGGLIGNNSGSASGSVFTNDGIVEGEDKVGGLFGINSGSFNTSSLINTVNAQVTGKQEVGGLIGKNTGKIEGGRDATDSYYKYQIYNNGTINVTGEGTHIGGLFGTNSGEVKAAYNTGVINAGQSSNVGGIAGANSGTLDQVFNTVMTETGTSAITGDTNVGGLVGTNSGTLSNAYNTTAVKAENGVAGNAVGVNADTGTITNIYASNTSGKLIGNNINTAQDAIQNAYSFVKDDTSATTVLDEKVAQKAEESYGFDNKDDGTTWKFYDGYSNPLLKVFLTTLTVDSDQVDLVYNAGEQDLNIGELVGNVITAPIVKDGEEIIYNGLDAYYNTVINGSDLGESELLQNTTGQKDAGTYDNWLYSGQIASGSKDGSGFNPNNLGYDIVYTKNDSGETGVEIGKATINIDLGKVEHTYGNADVINGTGDFKNEAGYGFNITNSNLTQEMKDELNDKGLGFVFEKDNALTDDTSGRVTEDVKDGGYTWSANFELSEELKKNYQFDDNGSATLNKADGQSIVNQAKLEISVDDAETMPGVMPGFTGKVEGLTNGDDTSLDYVFGLGANGNSIINVNGIYDNAIGIVVDGKYYELNAAWTDGLFKNYNVTYNMGTLTVDSEIMPDLPDNWPNNRWDYLFGDNPFDRNENFRERKAEVNFVDGAMEI